MHRVQTGERQQAPSSVGRNHRHHRHLRSAISARSARSARLAGVRGARHDCNDQSPFSHGVPQPLGIDGSGQRSTDVWVGRSVVGGEPAGRDQTSTVTWLIHRRRRPGPCSPEPATVSVAFDASRCKGPSALAVM